MPSVCIPDLEKVATRRQLREVFRIWGNLGKFWSFPLGKFLIFSLVNLFISLFGEFLIFSFGEIPNFLIWATYHLTFWGNSSTILLFVWLLQETMSLLQNVAFLIYALIYAEISILKMPVEGNFWFFSGLFSGPKSLAKSWCYKAGDRTF